MQFQSFINKLRQQLTEPLPGEVAQFKMAPERRITISEYYELGNNNPRPSAVLICLYPYQENIYTLLMLRPEEQGAHSGQISFPGGRFETSDIMLQTTALREANEEIGLDQRKVTVLGALTKLYIPVSNSMVQPFIGYIDGKPELKKNEEEVKEIIETDISLIMNPSLKGYAIFTGFNKFQIEAPYYNIYGHKVWGATAMILSELESLIALQ